MQPKTKRKNKTHFFLPVLEAVRFAFTQFTVCLNRRARQGRAARWSRVTIALTWIILSFQDQGTQDLIHGSSFSISLFESHCISTPRLLFTKTWFPISLILATLVILGLLSSLLMQLKILVSAAFYPSVEEQRIQYLHAKLMKRRLKQPRGEDKRKLSSYYTKVRSWEGGKPGRTAFGIWRTSAKSISKHASVSHQGLYHQ